MSKILMKVNHDHQLSPPITARLQNPFFGFKLSSTQDNLYVESFGLSRIQEKLRNDRVTLQKFKLSIKKTFKNEKRDHLKGIGLRKILGVTTGSLLNPNFLFPPILINDFKSSRGLHF